MAVALSCGDPDGGLLRRIQVWPIHLAFALRALDWTPKFGFPFVNPPFSMSGGAGMVESSAGGSGDASPSSVRARDVGFGGGTNPMGLDPPLPPRTEVPGQLHIPCEASKKTGPPNKKKVATRVRSGLPKGRAKEVTGGQPASSHKRWKDGGLRLRESLSATADACEDDDDDFEPPQTRQAAPVAEGGDAAGSSSGQRTRSLPRFAAVPSSSSHGAAGKRRLRTKVSPVPLEKNVKVSPTCSLHVHVCCTVLYLCWIALVEESMHV